MARCGVLLFLLGLTCNPGVAKSVSKRKNGPQPEVRIPVAALGYLPPGELPQFSSEALVGLYFIDETHLLFTFGVKGLLRRDSGCAVADSERKVRAVVLDIPSGKVERQTEWELYDFSDYLWSLGAGQFLLRRCSQLYIVDSTLQLHPLIETTGAVEWIGFAPDRSIVVVEQDVPGPAERPKAQDPLEYPPVHKVDVEFVQLHPPALIARARLPMPSGVPIVAQGILETLIAPHQHWAIGLDPFHGAERRIVNIGSTCMPPLTALTNTAVVAGVCSGQDDRKFEAFDLNGKLLWQMQVDSSLHLPRFLLTRNDVHFAIESLHAIRHLDPLYPLSRKVIDTDVIDIYDTSTGVRIGGLQISPVYTAGKNVDFSPDGTRLAALHDGAIEIYTVDELGKYRE